MDVEMDYQQTLDEEEVEILLGDAISTTPAQSHPSLLQQPVREDTVAPDVFVVPEAQSRIAQPPPSKMSVAFQPSASTPNDEAHPPMTTDQVGEGEGKERK